MKGIFFDKGMDGKYREVGRMDVSEEASVVQMSSGGNSYIRTYIKMTDNLPREDGLVAFF